MVTVADDQSSPGSRRQLVSAVDGCMLGNLVCLVGSSVADDLLASCRRLTNCSGHVADDVRMCEREGL